MNSDIKVAVIGSGNWGKNLVRNFRALGALGAIVETDAGLRAKLADEYSGIPLYDDYRDVWATDIPAVVIATPAATHYAIAREALLAGKDVFVEKPMTLSAAEAEDLVRIAQQEKRILMVGHLLLYEPAVGFIKEYLEAGKLGTLYSLHQERLNLGRVRTIENVLWSLAVHDIAVFLYLVEEKPTQVTASGHCILQPGIEDDVYLHLEFPEGMHAHLHTSWLWPEKTRRLVLVGSEGMMVYDELSHSVTLHHKGIHLDLSNHDDGSEIMFQGDGEPLAIECQHFLDCVAARKAPLSDGHSGVEVVRVMELATQSLKEQQL
ncbi:MAG: Gfo/Idh/MocA family oxidoreductase [Firmicutes bacterium]|nr:Gfo/Idh/MocA family oxidoreductase [Bacillota bacterium]